MGIKIIAQNKRASFDYALEEKLEAGIVLVGTEVKSLREGKVSINEAFIGFDKRDELWAYNILIPHYAFGNQFNHEENRKRKLLVHKKEAAKLKQKMKMGGYTIVPTIIYFKDSNVKIEIALGKGKKLHDKRQDQQKKDVERKLKQRNFDV